MTDLTAAVVLAIRIGLPGWLWTMPRADAPSPRTAGERLSHVGRAMALGLVLNLLPALCVAQQAAWTPGVDWALWAGVVLAGCGWRRRSFSIRAWSMAACTMGFLAIVTAVILWRPPRSEWFAGGWDPGLYQNAAVLVARSHGFAAWTDNVYALLTQAERSLFGAQAFRGVPILAGTGAIEHHFFQLTPLCGALWYRWGGLDLLSRMTPMLAFMGLPVVWALAGALGIAGWRRGGVLAAWCVSPLWWYQQAIPTTEMLQLLLLCGAAVFYADAERNGAAIPWRAALLLFALAINHFGFAPLIAMMLVVAAAAESFAHRPGRAGRFLTCAGALAAGLAWDLVFSAATIEFLQVKDQVLPLVLGPFALCVVAGAGIGSPEIPPRLAAGTAAVVRRGALSAGLLLIVLTAILACPFAEPFAMRHAERIPVLWDWLRRFGRFLPFHGTAWFLLLGVGTCFLARDTTPDTRRVRVLATALAGIVLLLFLNPGIAPLYPWAFRRYVVFLLPLMALVLGTGITVPVPPGREGLLGRLTVGLLAMAVLLTGIRASRPAARVGDYVGFRNALTTLNRSIRDGDIVVADDQRAGTPLLLMYGRDVLNGTRLWNRHDPEYQRRYLAMLRRLQREAGRRIIWLTSTEQAMELYPPAVGPAIPLTDPLDITTRTVVHSPNGDGFETREHHSRFQLHRWLEP